jgi:hypothetical protein
MIMIMIMCDLLPKGREGAQARRALAEATAKRPLRGRRAMRVVA